MLVGRGSETKVKCHLDPDGITDNWEMSRLISVQNSDASVTGLEWMSPNRVTNEQVLDKGVRLGIGSILIR